MTSCLFIFDESCPYSSVLLYSENILFIITKKSIGKERKCDGVSVMKDKDVKVEDVKVPHTLGWVSYKLLVKFLYIDSTEEVVSLFEVELLKPRNLSVHESEECENVPCVYFHQNKKRRGPTEWKCHSKTMINTKEN